MHVLDYHMGLHDVFRLMDFSVVSVVARSDFVPAALQGRTNLCTR